MKKPILYSALFISIFLLTQSSAFSGQHFEKKLEKKQHKQSLRIEKGLERGEFTYHEIKRLFKQQHKLDNLSHEFNEDGYYARRERKILTKKFDEFDEMIKRMRHNEKKYFYVLKQGLNTSRYPWKTERHGHSF